jgi:hypothetical protein
MFKKYSILVWVVLLLILVGIYLAVEYTSSADRTFRQKVTSYNADDITALRINSKPDSALVELKKEEGTWYIYSGGKSYSAEPKAVSHILELLNNMSTESIVATKEDKWADYQVDEEQAIIVELFAGDDRIERVYIGKFGFKQIPSQNPQQKAQPKMTSYVRTENDVMVYAVDGILRMSFQEGKQSFRNRTLFSCNDPFEISSVRIISLGDELVLDLSTVNWTLNGIAVDSSLTAKYINELSRINSSHFADDIDIEGMDPSHTVVIEGKTFKPVTLEAYPADSIIGHYVTSTYSPGNVYNGSKVKLFEKVFAVKEKFQGE